MHHECRLERLDRSKMAAVREIDFTISPRAGRGAIIVDDVMAFLAKLADQKSCKLATFTADVNALSILSTHSLNPSLVSTITLCSIDVMYSV